MAVQSVTNMSPGPRVLNAKIGEFKDKDGKVQPVIEMVHLAPGETKDMELLDPEHPIVKAMKESGELVLGKPGSRPPTPAEKVERDAEAAADAVKAAHQAGFDEATWASAAQVQADRARYEAALVEANQRADMAQAEAAKQLEAVHQEGFDAGYAKAKAEVPVQAATDAAAKATEEAAAKAKK